MNEVVDDSYILAIIYLMEMKTFIKYLNLVYTLESEEFSHL